MAGLGVPVDSVAGFVDFGGVTLRSGRNPGFDVVRLTAGTKKRGVAREEGGVGAIEVVPGAGGTDVRTFVVYGHGVAADPGGQNVLIFVGGLLGAGHWTKCCRLLFNVSAIPVLWFEL